MAGYRRKSNPQARGSRDHHAIMEYGSENKAEPNEVEEGAAEDCTATAEHAASVQYVNTLHHLLIVTLHASTSDFLQTIHCGRVAVCPRAGTAATTMPPCTNARKHSHHYL